MNKMLFINSGKLKPVPEIIKFELAEWTSLGNNKAIQINCFSTPFYRMVHQVRIDGGGWKPQLCSGKDCDLCDEEETSNLSRPYKEFVMLVYQLDKRIDFGGKKGSGVKLFTFPLGVAKNLGIPDAFRWYGIKKRHAAVGDSSPFPKYIIDRGKIASATIKKLRTKELVEKFTSYCNDNGYKHFQYFSR